MLNWELVIVQVTEATKACLFLYMGLIWVKKLSVCEFDIEYLIFDLCYKIRDHFSIHIFSPYVENANKIMMPHKASRNQMDIFMKSTIDY